MFMPINRASRPASEWPWLRAFALVASFGALAGAGAAPVSVGYDAVLEPIAYIDGHGQAAGFAAEYVRAVATAAGFDVAFATGRKEQLQADFREGRIAIIAVLVFTEERAKVMDFTTPYLTLKGAVFVRKDTDSIRSTADFSGRKIAVSRGNVTHTYMLAHPEWGAQLELVDSTEAALRAVQSGACDAAVNVDLVAQKIIREQRLAQVVRNEIELPGLVYKYCMAVQKGNDALLRQLNEAQLAVHERGEFATIYEKWIGPLHRRGLAWREVRPFAVPAALVLILLAVAFAWQRRNLRRLSLQAKALRRSEERLTLVLRSGRHSLWDWDIPHNRIERGPVLAALLDYPPDEIAPGPAGLAGLLHPDDRPKLEQVLADIARPGGASEFIEETRMRSRSGEWRWIATVGRVVERDASGRALRAVGTHTDITERKEAEEAVRRLNRELEQRVGERTAELAARVTEVERLNTEQQALMRDLRTSQQAADRTAARLQEANSNLLAANQELEAFSYSVSHDLRAPLRNITGFLELLGRRAQGRLDPEGERFVSVVTTEAGRMGMLIDDLLTFSRIGQTEMRLQPVDLGALVADVRDGLKPDVGERAVEWQIGPLPVVRGDPALLRQVVANLLGNAVKFTRRCPAARIEVGAGAPARGEHLVTIFVRDNGAGFNPRYLDKLFGVFQRLHNSRDFEGTGIGLANVKRIITRHGGRVWAEGQVDRGATFYFTLAPAAPADQPVR